MSVSISFGLEDAGQLEDLVMLLGILEVEIQELGFLLFDLLV
jgi:hypothetical protein